MAVSKVNSPMRSGRACHGFTLIELLVVIAIMAIIFVIALPRFDDIGRGSKMRSAISEIRSTVGLARQWAIANRQNVYIIFPDDWDQVYGGLPAEDHKKALRALAVYAEPPTGGSGVYIKDWTYLPSGIFLVDQNNARNPKTWDTRLVSTANVLRQPTVEFLPFPTATSTRKSINALRFRPDGICTYAPVSGDTSTTHGNRIYLSEGVALEGTEGKVVNIVWKRNPVLWHLRVNPYTGAIRVVDESAGPPL
jgi:prepilin-type N-terminal cleavage/methylation domain-containing protein